MAGGAVAARESGAVGAHCCAALRARRRARVGDEEEERGKPRGVREQQRHAVGVREREHERHVREGAAVRRSAAAAHGARWHRAAGQQAGDGARFGRQLRWSRWLREMALCVRARTETAAGRRHRRPQLAATTRTGYRAAAQMVLGKRGARHSRCQLGAKSARRHADLPSLTFWHF